MSPVEYTRDALLTTFGKETLADRYLQEGEGPQDLFWRVASYYSTDDQHAMRMYGYISKLWFMPSTPILSNGGTDRGLPISCFLNEVPDSLEGIVNVWNENVWLAARGGGLGTYWGNLRSIGEKVGRVGRTSGIMPFVKVSDSLTLAISQGSLRRGNGAVYLPVDHPEIEEFLEMRRPTGGDPNRKALNLHHGIVISDAFMHSVARDLDWSLVSPHTGETVRTVKARDLWIRILTARIETGEPYLLFIDSVTGAQPLHQKHLGLWSKTSNLCSEITLPTGPDYSGNHRTAVCCLGSLNLEKYDEWEDDPLIVQDCLMFLDSVLSDFIEKAPKEMQNAAYAAKMERSIGLGVMGFHSLLQQKGVPFGSAMAKAWNNRIFHRLHAEVRAADSVVSECAPPNPDWAKAYGDGVLAHGRKRWSNATAIAPTASISIICGGASPGVEPIVANAFIHKTLSGSTLVKNKYLEALLEAMGKNTPEVWTSIVTNGGSVQHLDFLDEPTKEVYKTAFEIDQRWVVDLAADRTPMIDQSQSINVFLPADVSKDYLHRLHFMAWERGLKSLYYCRSKAIRRAEVIASSENFDECLACQ